MSGDFGPDRFLAWWVGYCLVGLAVAILVVPAVLIWRAFS